MLSDTLPRRTVLLGLFGLAGCGFAPVYSDAGNLRGAFDFQSDETVMGYHLGAQLSARLGQPSSPRFLIKVRLEVSERAAAITAEGDTARLNVIGMAHWTVSQPSTGQDIQTGTVEAFTSYSATGSTVATQTTRDDAQARLAVILADMITTRILANAADYAG